MLGAYKELIRRYPRYLAFSGLHIFFSSPGQSFSFALFGPPFVIAFGLGAGGFGALYSIATLISAGLLPIVGPVIDRVNLRGYSVAVGLLMIIALLTMSIADSLPLLFVGMLFLRFSGQALMMQIGGISTTRFFGEQRGKALAIVGLGVSFGVALFPMTLARLITRYGWSKTLEMEALLVALVFLPISLILLRKSDNFQHPPPRSSRSGDKESADWTRKDVLKNPFFYFAIPTGLLIPFFSTGLIIHLGSVAEYKGWKLEWVAASFIASAVTSRLGSFCMGPLVDRFSARKMFRFVLAPYALALIVLMTNTHPYAAPVWLGLAGFSVGCVMVAMPVLWAEMFGVHSLGAISSVASSAGVLSTALSPILFGWLIEYGLNIDLLLLAGVFLTVIVSALAFLAPESGTSIKSAREPDSSARE
jgi:MFS family permease